MKIKNYKNAQGRWNKSQQDRFMRALEKYGRDWNKVQRAVRTRDITQVRSHAQKCFLKMEKKDIDALIAGDSDSESEENELNFSYKYNKLNQEGAQLSEHQDPPKQSNLFSLMKKHITEEVTNDSYQSAEKNQSHQIFSSSQFLQHYFSNDLSYFLKIFIQNGEYFHSGGNFIDLVSPINIDLTPKKGIQLCTPQTNPY